MTIAKRVALYVAVGLITVAWALIIDGLTAFGSPAYAVPYPAARLCRSLRSGMEVKDAEAKIYLLGRPGWTIYSNGQLIIGSVESQCTLDIDPTTNRIVKITISDVPVLF